MPASPPVPVLLLKTRSQPHDAYEEYFAAFSDPDSTLSACDPQFVPVLEHKANDANLKELEGLLGNGQLGEKYGGMVFTSQRAVEAWTDVVKRAEASTLAEQGTGVIEQRPKAIDPTNSTPAFIDDDFAFPLYTVGPATSRALTTLVTESTAHAASPFAQLRPEVLGAQTGNGAALAQYILGHYNGAHSRRLYTFYEAPRLPFTPLLGPGRADRVDKDDARLRKKGLLFLVGEQRRDIIPKTLMDETKGNDRIRVDEVEVYATGVMPGFQQDFEQRIEAAAARRDAGGFVVIVVFSGQGCDTMLRSLGYIDAEDRLTRKGRERWTGDPADGGTGQRYIIVTIGPTTRDQLKSKFDFDADVCAAKPSPEGIGDGLRTFFRQKGL